MPRVEIPVTDITREGVENATPVVSDATNDHYVPGNNGKVFLEVENTGGSPATLTVVPNPDYLSDGLPVEDLVLTIPAGEKWKFGPFRALTFRQNSSSDMYINPSVSTTLLITAYRFDNV